MKETEKKQVQDDLMIENRFHSGANWFFWIAGLSLVNSIVVLAESDWNFIVGLGITQIVDGMALALAAEIGQVSKIIGFGVNALIAGAFCLFGVFARKKHTWAFIVGMILYALDGLMFLLIRDFLGLGFHAFALYCIYSGMKALHQSSETRLSSPSMA
jgi:hypothetical protein